MKLEFNGEPSGDVGALMKKAGEYFDARDKAKASGDISSKYTIDGDSLKASSVLKGNIYKVGDNIITGQSSGVYRDKNTGKIYIYAPEEVTKNSDSFKTLYDNSKSLLNAYAANPTGTYISGDGETRSLYEGVKAVSNQLESISQAYAAYTDQRESLSGKYGIKDMTDDELGRSLTFANDRMKDSSAVPVMSNESLKLGTAGKFGEAVLKADSYDAESGYISYGDFKKIMSSLSQEDKVAAQRGLAAYMSTANKNSTQEVVRGDGSKALWSDDFYNADSDESRRNRADLVGAISLYKSLANNKGQVSPWTEVESRADGVAFGALYAGAEIIDKVEDVGAQVLAVPMYAIGTFIGFASGEDVNKSLDKFKNIYGDPVFMEGFGIGESSTEVIDKMRYGTSHRENLDFEFDSTGLQSNRLIGLSGLATGKNMGDIHPDGFYAGYMFGNTAVNLSVTMAMQKALLDPIGQAFGTGLSTAVGGVLGAEKAKTLIKGSSAAAKLIAGAVGFGVSMPNIIKNFENGNWLGGVASTYFSFMMTANVMGSPNSSVAGLIDLAGNVALQSGIETILVDGGLRSLYDAKYDEFLSNYSLNALYNYVGEQSGIGSEAKKSALAMQYTGNYEDEGTREILRVVNRMASKKHKFQASVGELMNKILPGEDLRAKSEIANLKEVAEAEKLIGKADDAEAMKAAILNKIDVELSYDHLRASGLPNYLAMLMDDSVKPEVQKLTTAHREIGRYLTGKGADLEKMTSEGFTYGREIANYMSYKIQSEVWLAKADGNVENKNYIEAMRMIDVTKEKVVGLYGNDVLPMIDNLIESARAANYKVQLYADAHGVSDEARAEAIATGWWGENGELFLPLSRIITEQGQSNISRIQELVEAQEAGNFRKVTTELGMEKMGDEIDTVHDFMDPLMILNGNWRTIGTALAVQERAQALHNLHAEGMARKVSEETYESSKRVTKESLQKTQGVIEENLKNITKTTLGKDRGGASIEGAEVVDSARAVWNAVQDVAKSLDESLPEGGKALAAKAKEVKLTKTAKNNFVVNMNFQVANQMGFVSRFNLLNFDQTFRTKSEFLDFSSNFSKEQIQIFQDAMLSNGIIDPASIKRSVTAKYIPAHAKNMAFEEVVTADGFKPTNKDFGKSQIETARKTGEVTVYVVGNGKVSGSDAIRVYTSLSQARGYADSPISEKGKRDFLFKFNKHIASVRSKLHTTYMSEYVIAFEKAADAYNKAIDDKEIKPLAKELSAQNKFLEDAKKLEQISEEAAKAPRTATGEPKKGKVWEYSDIITKDNAKYLTSNGEKFFKADMKDLTSQRKSLLEITRKGTESEREAAFDKLDEVEKKIAEAEGLLKKLRAELPKAQKRRDAQYNKDLKAYKASQKAESKTAKLDSGGKTSDEIQKTIDDINEKIEALENKKIQVDGTPLRDAGRGVTDAYDYIVEEIPHEIINSIRDSFSKSTRKKIMSALHEEQKYENTFSQESNLKSDMMNNRLVFGDEAKERYGLSLKAKKADKLNTMRVRLDDVSWDSDAAGYIIKSSNVNKAISGKTQDITLSTQDLNTKKVEIWNKLVKQDPDFASRMFQSDVQAKCAEEIRNSDTHDSVIREYVIGQQLGDDYFRYRQYIEQLPKVKEAREQLYESTKGIYKKASSDSQANIKPGDAATYESVRKAVGEFRDGIDLATDNIVSYLGNKLLGGVEISKSVIAGFKAAGYSENDAISYMVLDAIAPKGSKFSYEKALKSNKPNAEKMIADAVEEIINERARDTISKSKILDNELKKLKEVSGTEKTEAYKEKAKELNKLKSMWTEEKKLREGNLIFNSIMENLQSKHDSYTSSLIKSGHNELVDMKKYMSAIKDQHRAIYEEAGRKYYEGGRNVVLSIDGKREIWEVDEGTMIALSPGRGTPAQGKWTQLSKLSQRGFRAGTTGALAPSSLISQWCKDPISAFISSGSIAFKNGAMSSVIGGDVTSIMNKAMVDDIAPRILDNIREEFPEIADKMVADAKNSGMDLNQYVVSNVVGGTYSALSESITLENEFFRDIKKTREGSFNSLKGKSPETINDKINKMSDAVNNTILKYLNVENYGAARESYLRSNVYNDVFASAIKNGCSNQEAKQYAEFYSRNATTNFDRSLTFGNKIADAVPYLSAAINGSKSFWRLFELDPVGVSSRLGTMYFMYMYMVEESLSNEDDKKVYEQLREYQKDGNIIWVEHGVPFTIPVPEEVSRFLNPARWSAEIAMGSNKNTQLQLITNTALSLSPVNLTGFMDLDRNNIATSDYDLWSNMEFGVGKMFSQISGPIAKTWFSVATGIDPFTGAKIDNSYWTEDEDGRAVKMDNTQGKVANLLASIIPGLSPSAAENILKNIFGKSGREDLESLASILTGDFGGGISRFSSQVISPLTVDAYDRMRSDRISLVSEAYRQKDELMNNPQFREQMSLYNKYRQSGDMEKARVAYGEIKTMVQEFQSGVLSKVKELQTLYGTDIYTNNFQASIISLMTFDDDLSITPVSSYSSASGGKTEHYAARDLAIQSMVDAGFPDIQSSGVDLSILGYGYYYNGEYKYAYANPVTIMAAEMNESSVSRIATDRIQSKMDSTGLTQVRKNMNDQVDAMYDTIKNRKMSKNDWQSFNDRLDKIYAQYDSQVFLQVIFPTFMELENAGQSVSNYINYNLDDFDNLIKVPNAYMGRGKYDSKISKQRAYVKSYIEDMYNSYKKKLKGGK